MIRPALYAFPDDGDATLDHVLAQIEAFSCQLVVTPLGVERGPGGQRRSMVAVEAFTPLAAQAFAMACEGSASRID